MALFWQVAEEDVTSRFCRHPEIVLVAARTHRSDALSFGDALIVQAALGEFEFRFDPVVSSLTQGDTYDTDFRQTGENTYGHEDGGESSLSINLRLGVSFTKVRLY